MRFVLIPSGSFMMGAGPTFQGQSDYERPSHRVTITRSFHMSVTPVTQAQWAALTGSSPSMFKGADKPVENVSHNDIVQFVAQLNAREGRENYRLPTEAEWEYAALAGSTARYCFGDGEMDLERYAWYNADHLKGAREGGTHPVATKAANAWGLHDVHGNVFEWTSDWFGEGYYAKSPRNDPRGPSSGTARVTRGGSWGSDSWFCQAAARNSEAPDQRSMYTGFRLVRILQ
jgi:formylglycine-generating enzyme required for sulfatase activity